MIGTEADIGLDVEIEGVIGELEAESLDERGFEVAEFHGAFVGSGPSGGGGEFHGGIGAPLPCPSGPLGLADGDGVWFALEGADEGVVIVFAGEGDLFEMLGVGIELVGLSDA